MGFLVLYPQPGIIDISLRHSRIWQERLGYLISFGSIAFIIWYGLVGVKKYPVFSKAVSGKKEEGKKEKEE